LKPVLPEDAEDYDEYVIYPMDIAKLEKNIKQRQYGSTEAFLSDAQWIVHNSIIFNSGKVLRFSLLSYQLSNTKSLKFREW
jgi:hypothetical protein